MRTVFLSANSACIILAHCLQIHNLPTRREQNLTQPNMRVTVGKPEVEFWPDVITNSLGEKKKLFSLQDSKKIQGTNSSRESESYLKVYIDCSLAITVKRLAAQLCAVSSFPKMARLFTRPAPT